MASVNEDSVEKKLKTVINTQDSIQSLSLWIIHHKSHHSKIVELWLKVLKKSVLPSHRLTLFYLCNDVVQTCKKKKAQIYINTFKEHLTEAARLVRDVSVKDKIERIFKIWQERGVYSAKFIDALNTILSGGKPAPVNVNDPISPTASPYDPSYKPDTPKAEASIENNQEDDIDENARILAEFKPHEMIEQITAFRRNELEIQIRLKQLSHLRLDASSLTAVKQLKDRAHGNEFSNQFEDSCTKLEDLVKRQTQHLTDQKALLEILKTSETFYDAQYREARIVANAYKNFGARINNMKKKLDEMKKTMPKPDSPIPSPDINAPSPENSPPFAAKSGYDFNSSNSLMGFQPNSPPLEAPSPEGSPPDLNLGGSDNGPTSLDSRLASFMDRSNRNGVESSQPSYTPASMNLAVSSSHSKASRLADDDGNNTPLDDEAPTTPVQDEHTTPPPRKNNTPPKKENPIDFLSRLISQTQTQKEPSTKTGAASFLESLTMLSGVSKSSSLSKTSPEIDGRGDSHKQQQPPPPPPPWSWNTSNTGVVNRPVSSQPSSPSSIIPTQATSPSTPFSRPPPTMVPPPPIPPQMSIRSSLIPQLSPSVNPVTINLSIPPPPPPPFLVRPPRMDFSAPPPFQQTSPGQKENWPEKGSIPDHSNMNRSASPSSVLMELTPAKGYEEISNNSPIEESKPMDTDAMEIVSDDEEELDALMDDSDPEMEIENEGHEEFASKLKEKTIGGNQSDSLKSSIAVPNSNLVTIPVSEDTDNDLLNDDSTNDGLDWITSKSHKSKKSRSRSRSKEKSHKHKKKKKHKRKTSDDDEFDEGRSTKKVSSRSASSRSSKDGKYDRYDDRSKYDGKYKYDRYDDKKFSSSRNSDYKPSYSSSSSSSSSLRDARDPRSVEAYTQAFIQQYSQATRYTSGYGGSSASSDPRRSTHNKY